MRRPGLAALVVLTVAGAATWMTRHRAPATTSPSAQVPSPVAPFRWAWSAGTRLVYDVSWRATQENDAFQPPVRGTTEVRGRLVLRAFGEDPATGEWDVRATLVELRAARLRVLEHELLPEDALGRPLEGKEAFLRITPRGRIASIGFRTGEDEIFSHLASWLVARITVELPEAPLDAPFVTLEPHALGRARVRYEPTGGNKLARTLLGFDELRIGAEDARAVPAIDGRGSVELEGGHLVRLEDREKIRVEAEGGAILATMAAELSLALVEQGRFDPAPELTPPPLVLRRLEGGDTSTVPRRVLEARVAGLTTAQMTDHLVRFGAAGRMPQHRRWLWRATGLLLLERESARELGAVFRHRRVGPKGRALVLDLLASVSTPEAQAMLRELLATPEARDDGEELVMLVQRLALVQGAEPATVAFAEAEHVRAEPGSDLWMATAMTLGAVVANAPAGTADANRAAARLVDELREASSPEARAALVRALGNAGNAAHLPAILAHAPDSDSRVRAAVASALRTHDVSKANDALVVFAADDSDLVQREALSSLRQHALSDEAWRALSASTPKTAPAAAGSLVTFLAQRMRVPEGPVARRALGVMRAAALELAAGDPGLRDRVEALPEN